MLVKKYMEPVADNWLKPELTLYEAVCAMRRSDRESKLSVNGMGGHWLSVPALGETALPLVLRPMSSWWEWQKMPIRRSPFSGLWYMAFRSRFSPFFWRQSIFC